MLLYKDNNTFFTPVNISQLTDVSLSEYLKQYLRPRYINEAVKRFKLNTQVLNDKYKGDPRKIFDDTTTCQQVVRRLKDFRGFGPKSVTFLSEQWSIPLVMIILTLIRSYLLWMFMMSESLTYLGIPTAIK